MVHAAVTQVVLVQAQSRQRLAEQRASDAEQMSNELQARLKSMCTQQQALRADMDSQSTSTTSAAMQIWRIKVGRLTEQHDDWVPMTTGFFDTPSKYERLTELSHAHQPLPAVLSRPLG